MSLKRDAELSSPLLSDEEVLRRAALLQITRVPTVESAKAIIRALLHFLEDRPEIAEEFVDTLWRPPLGPLAEEPVLDLLKTGNEPGREQAAFILYKLKIRESSRQAVERALREDRSPWVRAYAAKALAVLGGKQVPALLAEAIDNEATLEAISRMAEALALTRDPAQAEVLRDQAEQLRERQPPADTAQPPAWLDTAQALACFLDALAGVLGDPGDATIEGESPGPWIYRHPDGTVVQLAGGAADLGFAARVIRPGKPPMLLRQDSEQAVARLPALEAPES